MSRKYAGLLPSDLQLTPKQALVIAKEEGELYDNIRTSVAGICFLGTPHRGSPATQIPLMLTSIANITLSGLSRFIGHSRPELIKALKKDSKILLEISTRFRNQTGSIKIASFTEQSINPPANSLVRYPSCESVVPD